MGCFKVEYKLANNKEINGEENSKFINLLVSKFLCHVKTRLSTSAQFFYKKVPNYSI